ncbi:MAG: hypothetical protein NTZ30_05815 [Planctomycetota bacterium]|nr:hypothetical protein [Planctomycetota bacterium]
MLRRIFPIRLLLALVWGFGLIQAWQKDYKGQLSFIPPNFPNTARKIITSMIAFESANIR